MSIFISYRHIDAYFAGLVAESFKINNVPYYIDRLDPELKTDKEITETISERVRECTHLMAVVSEATKYSWWVPFEIGLATAKDKRISTLTLTQIELPGYLNIWPVLRTWDHFHKYLEVYFEDRATLIEQKAITDAVQAPVQTADDFHRRLMIITGQIS